jgi:hypothetical protein
MQTQQVAFRQQSHNANHPVLPDLESSFADHTSRAPAVYSDEVPLLAARLSAMRAADQHWLPMTVYRNSDSYGWAYTNPISRVLHQAEVFVTILPSNFFR